MKSTAVLVCLVFLAPGLLTAQTTDAMQEKFKALEERIAALEAEVQALKSAQSTPAAPSPAAAMAEEKAPPPAEAQQPAPTAPPTVAATPVLPGESAGQLPVYGGASAAAKALNPDISVIGDFLGTVGHNPVAPVPSFEMHESEVGFQAIVDPYARADFFFSFGEEGVNLEEGYITFTSLPFGLVAKAGKMRSAFGKVNTLHNHVLPWTDRPMVTDNLVGGEDGIDDAGFSVTRILPAPKGIFLEGTAQLFRGDSTNVFHAYNNSDVSPVFNVHGYSDLTESTNLDLGFSYAQGHNFSGPQFMTRLYDAYGTLRWKPLRRAIYHSFVGRSEFIWSDHQQTGGAQHAFGFYVSGDYQPRRRWFIGGRYDYSERAQAANLTDSGASAILTYWPSEFSQLRGQYRFARYAGGHDASELRFQLLFSLGAHGAHPF